MVKLRSAYYCNLKLILIFMVIYGHLIEREIWQSEFLMLQYKWIYMIHMPMFSFLSGLFLTNAGQCGQQLVRMLPLYLVLQTLAVICSGGEIRLLTPYWHLWYLLSNCIWLAIAWTWHRFFYGKGKTLVLVASIAAGCAVGYASFIGRDFSLSRTVVFFPYFWLGLIGNPQFRWDRLRRIALLTLAAAGALMLWIDEKISVSLLYQATAYSDPIGAVHRLVCYLIAGGFGLFLLALMPGRRFIFTKLGTDTMYSYLLHAPFVLCLRPYRLPWPCYILITAGFMMITERSFRWFSNIHGIVSERKNVGGYLSKRL
ncbi:MAG: hypothetical protein E7467_09035 [Ruminococcaceae bacterium]|nr:hypothetical protein [Oscillospiraceae bacterium]